MTSAPNQWHTILSDGNHPDVVRDKAERRQIEQHVGRFILTWGYLDFTLSMVASAWANPRRVGTLQRALFSQRTGAKIDMLEALLPKEWRDGRALIFHMREGNNYRNKIAHFSLALSGQDGDKSYGWHFWKLSAISRSV